MAKKGMKIGMAPSHPGSFIKTEILDELGLSMTKYKGSDIFVKSDEVSPKTYEWLRSPGLRSRTDSAK